MDPDARRANLSIVAVGAGDEPEPIPSVYSTDRRGFAPITDDDPRRGRRRRR